MGRNYGVLKDGGIVDTSFKILEKEIKSKRDKVLQKDLVAAVSNKMKNHSPVSVLTLISNSKSPLKDPFTLHEHNLTFRKAPARFIKSGNLICDLQHMWGTYDCPQKNKVRKYLFSLLKGMERPPRFLTMASWEGLDVKMFKKEFPEGKVVNVERNPKLLAFYKKKWKLKSEDHKAEMNKYIQENADYQIFDLAFLDYCGSPAPSTEETLRKINETKNITYVAMTFICHDRYKDGMWRSPDKIMDKGQSWRDQTRKKYSESNFPMLAWAKDQMPNYKFIQQFRYTNQAMKSKVHMPMVVFVAKLKGE